MPCSPRELSRAWGRAGRQRVERSKNRPDERPGFAGSGRSESRQIRVTHRAEQGPGACSSSAHEKQGKRGKRRGHEKQTSVPLRRRPPTLHQAPRPLHRTRGWAGPGGGPATRAGGGGGRVCPKTHSRSFSRGGGGGGEARPRRQGWAGLKLSCASSEPKNSPAQPLGLGLRGFSAASVASRPPPRLLGQKPLPRLLGHFSSSARSRFRAFSAASVASRSEAASAASRPLP